MTNPKKFNNLLLNQIASEIVVLDDEFKILWLNDSAVSNGWIFSSDNSNIKDQFTPQTNNELFELLQDCVDSGKTITKRNFKLAKPNENHRIVDLTVTWSDTDNILIIEILCVDNLNKIIDSSKVFSTQKIAANLARTLAHEVKNPLSGIKGSAQILMNKLNDNFSKKFLDIIVNETERLNNIVTKILTPPKKPKLELFNIHSALEKVFALSEAEADEYGNLKIQRDYDPSIPEVYGDEDLFIQAILNIFKNAQQAIVLTEEPLITIKSRVTY